MAAVERESAAEAAHVLRSAFDAYNRQDADALLTMVAGDVRWPGEGGRILGQSELRAFWEEQWTRTRTFDYVTRIETVTDTEFLVSLDQVIRAVDGTKLSAGSFRYGFTVENGLISQLSSRDAVTDTPVHGT